ncbi:unnamed protein product [Cuscuta epithymum]|uniref:Uncharacterized protein n=2 Tax=Cuscuta epithymum TaxID=186058 RepID=A0AAV0G0I8_9ASTE|nr:unnamed protein product [Cuscuta epithymum]
MYQPVQSPWALASKHYRGFSPASYQSVPSLDHVGVAFTIVKSLASRIILTTGFMHVLPDSFDMLRSSLLDCHVGGVGLSLGATSNSCSIKGLIAALCFHQMFEGMGLESSILQAQYGLLKKASMAFFFSVTTPLGIAVGIGLSNTYKENSPRALITEGLLNGSLACLPIYMALVDLLAADFMGQKLQGSINASYTCMYCF